MLTSVIIPAHNEQDYIRATLESYARQQSEPHFETIVVANGCDSTDDTAQIAEDLGARVFELGKRNVSKARNHGVSCSSGDLLVFNDADTLVAPNYIDVIVNTLSNCDYGTARAKADKFTFGALTYALMLNVGGFILKEACGNVFVKREPFHSVNGFAEELKTGEDIDFSMRLRQNGAKYKFLWETNFKTSSRDVSFRRMLSESLGYIKLRTIQKE
jgi:glycosyltransferase involved in cell wall biosynthesis